MEKTLKEIVSILSAHREDYSFHLYSERGSDWTTPLQHPLVLDPTKHYEIALIYLETFYSIPNIRADNIMLRNSVDMGNSVRYIIIPVGSYELGQINDVIASEVRTLIEIKPNTATLHSIIKISDANVQVDMSRSTLRTVPGFNATTPERKPNILEMGSVESENTVNIPNISSILVSCDLGGNSYLNGDVSAFLYSFFPGVGVGHKIIQQPSQPLYLPITKRGSVNRIRLWITNQIGKLIDCRDENITVRLHIRSIQFLIIFKKMLVFDETSVNSIVGAGLADATPPKHDVATRAAKKKSDEIIQKVIERDTRESKFKLL